MLNVDTANTVTWTAAGPSMIDRVRDGSRPLAVTGLLMLGVLALAGAGLFLDDRLVAGAPVWMKPAKFAASTTVYAWTLAWIGSWLTDAPRTRRWVGWLTAVVFVVEVAIIALQAWRGTTSHFNAATPLDTALFGIMGTAISVQTAASGWMAVAVWRQRFDDPALGGALRAGLLLTILGAATGGLMTGPTPAQLAAAREGHRMSTVGAHTVGAPDGGPGLPGVGWSRAHGDLRVPHFVGLHAMQALPLLAFMWRRRPLAEAVSLVRVASASYAALFVLLLAQALRGESVAQPAFGTLLLFGAWAAATTAAVGAVVLRAPSGRRAATVMG